VDEPSELATGTAPITIVRAASDVAKRLPFALTTVGGLGRLLLVEHVAGLVRIDRLDLEISDLGTDPGPGAIERYQRKRTRLRTVALRIATAGLDDRVRACRRQLAGVGITGLSVRLHDGFVSVRARAAASSMCPAWPRSARVPAMSAIAPPRHG